MPSAHTSSDEESAEEDADFDDDSEESELQDISQSDDSVVDSEDGFDHSGAYARAHAQHPWFRGGRGRGGRGPRRGGR